MKNFKLDNEPKIKSGFKAPDEYFDTLSDTILEQLPKEETKVVSLYKRKPIWLSAAAVFILLIGGGLFLKLNTTPTTIQPDEVDIEDYLAYQANISYDLYENLNNEDIQELEQSIVISNEEIETYISTQNNYDIYLNE